MSIAADVAVLLRAEATITGAISGKTAGVYAGAAPQKDGTNVTVEPPYIVVTTINTDFYNTLDSSGGVATGVQMAVMDIDCKAKTEENADALKSAVASYFDDFTGTANDSTIDSVHLTDCGDDIEQPDHGQGLPVFVKTLEAEVTYS